MNKLSLWLNCRTARVDFFLFLASPFPYFMVNIQYPAGQGVPAQAALPAAQGVQPADELAAPGAQAASGKVAQVVQQVVGQEALPASNKWLRKFNQPRHKYLDKLWDKLNTKSLR